MANEKSLQLCALNSFVEKFMVEKRGKTCVILIVYMIDYRFVLIYV